MTGSGEKFDGRDPVSVSGPGVDEFLGQVAFCGWFRTFQVDVEIARYVQEVSTLKYLLKYYFNCVKIMLN